MFRFARIKLTAWYLLIIMFVSVCFSLAMYNVLTSELDRVERIQRSRIERGLPERPVPLSREFRLDPDIIEETKNHLKFILIAINGAILGSAALLGYFLAGKTMKPISEMVDEQNRFMADASHELRTPLTSLKSEIEVNLRDKKMTLGQAKKLLESNLEEVNNLQVLSDDLIKLTRYQKGENGLLVEEISLSSIIEEAIKKVAPLAKQKKITIVNKINDSSFEGNRQTLVELFVIFLDNAIKYSPKGKAVKLSFKKTDGSFQVSISDQGIGIDEKDLPHLFDRFYRVDKSRSKSETSGYGLGLSIAKQIVERHQGEIIVKSKINEGTVFIVQLPSRHAHDLI